MTALTDKEIAERRARLKERQAVSKLFAGDQTKTKTLQVSLYIATMRRIKDINRVAQRNIKTGYTFARQTQNIEPLIRQISEETVNLLVEQTPPGNPSRQFYSPAMRSAYNRGQAAAPSITGVFGGTLPTADIGATTGTLAQLMTRTFNSMRNLDASAKNIIRQTLSEGVLKGLGLRPVGDLLSSRVVGISEPRAELIARTEIVTARNRGYIDKTEQLTYDGKPYYYEWVASQDTRTRPSHRRRDGKVFTSQQALSLIGEPNCRCSLVAISPRDPRYKEVEKNLIKFI